MPATPLLPGPDPEPDGRRRCDTCGKQCLTRDEAHRAARNLNSHQLNDHWPVHAFQCGPWWHTGHVRTKDRRRKAAPRRVPFRPKPLTPRHQLPPELR